MSTLETRIDKLLSKLEEAKARKPSVISIPDDDTAVPSRRGSTAVQEHPRSSVSKMQKRKEASAIDDLVSDFGFLSVNATARDFYGFTAAMSYARLILWACCKDPLPDGTTKALPARYVANSLIQHYLNNVFVLLPVFDEASFFASVDNLYSRDSHKADPVDHWMVRMVLAIASAALSEQRGDQHYLEGIGHVCAALEHAEAVLHPGAISSVQALVLLTEYAMLDPHHFDYWSLIGAASRAMVDLGLHQDPPKGAQMSKGKLEVRRRVFHCVYALDRSTSLVQTRAFSFSDDSAAVKIPFGKTPPSQPTSPDAQGVTSKTWLQSYEQAFDLIQLRRLQSSWYFTLFQSGRGRWEEPYHYLWNTCNEMRTWFENLSASTSPNMRAFFELDLLFSYIYVLSPSPRVPVIHPFAAKLIFEYCIQYADLMRHVIEDPAYTAPLTFYDHMRVYMTGRRFLDVMQNGADMLLSGLIPPHPEVRPSTAPPPQMPVVPLPAGETLHHFHTARSIDCIEHITQCLSSFGIRWGYMSWHQLFRDETAEMRENLNQRLRDMDDMTGRRRPSMWPRAPGSSGSVHSSSGSSSLPYTSPQSSALRPESYHQSAITSSNLTAYEPPALPPTNLPPQHHYTTGQMPQHSTVAQRSYEIQPQMFQGHSGQRYGFHHNMPFSHPHPSLGAAAPSQQFAAWRGYNDSSGPDTLDEENAIPPKPGDWGFNDK